MHERRLPRADARRVYEALAEEADAQGVDDLDLREFECLGACDMAPMASFDGRYVGPMSVEDAPEAIRQLKNGETVLPGRGLEDAGFGCPTRRRSPRASRSTRSSSPPEARGPIPPTWTRRRRGPPPHRREATEPLAPGTSYAGEEIDPFTHDVLEPDDEEQGE